MTYSLYMTDHGPVRIGPAEEAVFLASRRAKELEEPASHPAIRAESQLAEYLMAIGERIHKSK